MNQTPAITPGSPAAAATSRSTTGRVHVHEEPFSTTPDRLFEILHTPSAIRAWWGASRAIVLPEANGVWAATWGGAEDAPDYVTVATIEVFDPPRRMRLSGYRYRARTGPAPAGDFTTEFVVEPHTDGAVLRVAQDGFPAGPDGDAFLAACETGWRTTFSGIRRYLTGA